MIALWIAGCVAFSGLPLVVAEDGGAGIWPGNTAYAVGRAIDAGVDGIELDVAVTADGVPVLATGGVLGPTCAGPTDEHPRVGEMQASELADWTCGGLPDPAWPSAEVHAEPVAHLDDVASLLAERGSSEMPVELTVIGDPGAVFDAWLSIDPANPLWLATDDPDAVDAMELAGAERAIEAGTILVVPGVPAGADLVGLGTVSPGDADAVAVPWERARRWEARDLATRGIGLTLLGVDDPGLVRALGSWPIAAVRTGYPGERP